MHNPLDALRSWWNGLRDRAERATRDTSTPSPSIWDRDGLVGRKLHDPDHDLELHDPDRLR
jgi:hypothetical protein